MGVWSTRRAVWPWSTPLTWMPWSVSEVYYPGLPGHLGHDVAERQMDIGFGPIVSFRTGGGAARAREVAARLGVFTDATSLGGVESLVEHRATVEGAGTTVPDDLLRLSIGIEDVSSMRRSA